MLHINSLPEAFSFPVFKGLKIMVHSQGPIVFSAEELSVDLALVSLTPFL